MALNNIEYGLGSALQGGGGIQKVESGGVSTSVGTLTLGATPLNVNVWIENKGEKLGRVLSGVHFRIALSPEIQQQQGLQNDLVGRLRLDLAAAEEHHVDIIGLYGAYDNDFYGDEAWAVGFQTPYIDPLMYAGMFTLQPHLFQLGLVTPGYVEYRCSRDGGEQTVTLGLRTQLAWKIFNSRRSVPIEN